MPALPIVVREAFLWGKAQPFIEAPGRTVGPLYLQAQPPEPAASRYLLAPLQQGSRNPFPPVLGMNRHIDDAAPGRAPTPQEDHHAEQLPSHLGEQHHPLGLRQEMPELPGVKGLLGWKGQLLQLKDRLEVC